MDLGAEGGDEGGYFGAAEGFGAGDEPVGEFDGDFLGEDAGQVGVAVGHEAGEQADACGRACRLEQEPGSIDPADPAAFATAFADAVNTLVADPDRARRMGEAGRRRAVEHFDWSAIADQTVALYRSLM